MHGSKILKIILFAVVLFLGVNYFIKHDDSSAINDVIDYKIDDNDDALDEMESIRDKYLSGKFKTFMIRAAVFAIILWFGIRFISEKKQIVIEAIPQKVSHATFFVKAPF